MDIGANIVSIFKNCSLKGEKKRKKKFGLCSGYVKKGLQRKMSPKDYTT